MSAAVPTTVPLQHTAGDTATWRVSLADYPASAGWELSYAFMRHDTGAKISITTTADGADHLVSELATETAGWVPGKYEGQAYVTKAAERYKVWEGPLEILINYADATDTDSRTIARKTLDAIEAAILKIHQANAAGRVGAITEWSAEGLSIKRENQADLLAELQKQRDRWAAIVRTQEDRAKLKLGRATGRRILTRFVPTT